MISDLDLTVQIPVQLQIPAEDPPARPGAGAGASARRPGEPVDPRIELIKGEIAVPVDPATGAVIKTVVLTVRDAMLTLTIPEGTIVKDAIGNPLLDPITMAYIPATAEQIGAITAYDLGPDGTTFSPSVELVIQYDDADIQEGYNELGIVIRIYDGTTWTTLETIIDPEVNTAVAKVSQFSIFALFATELELPVAEPDLQIELPVEEAPVEQAIDWMPMIIAIVVVVLILVVGVGAYNYMKK